MQRASIITAIPIAPSPPAGVTFVDRDLATSLLQNFLTALDADEEHHIPFMIYARRMAEWHLKQWDVAA